MYKFVFTALDQIMANAHRQSNLLSMVFMGQPFAPVADAAAHGPLATLYFINAMSAFDDALEIYIHNEFSNVKSRDLDSLGKRIKFLEKNAVLQNPALMKVHQLTRNTYAHEIGKYAKWTDLWQVVVDIENELRHLGIKRHAYIV